MTVSGQDFGTTDGSPVVVGKTIVVEFTIADLQSSEVTSAEWILADKNPEDDDPSILITKTVGSGIVLADSGTDLQVTVTVDATDTEDLDAGDYFHRLDYVHTDGSSYESARGTARLHAHI